jgi:hypothetical protein
MKKINLDSNIFLAASYQKVFKKKIRKRWLSPNDFTQQQLTKVGSIRLVNVMKFSLNFN